MKDMGSEQVLKKSVLGGFKKDGVINYVEQLQSEILELKREVANKPDLSDEYNAVKKDNENAYADIASLTAKCDAIKAENEALSNHNIKLSEELDEAKKVIAEYESKQKLFEEKILAIESKFLKIKSGYTSADVTPSEINNVVASAHSDISYANERIKTACNNFESSTSALKSSVDNLLNVLASINENINNAE